MFAVFEPIPRSIRPIQHVQRDDSRQINREVYYPHLDWPQRWAYMLISTHNRPGSPSGDPNQPPNPMQGPGHRPYLSLYQHHPFKGVYWRREEKMPFLSFLEALLCGRLTVYLLVADRRALSQPAIAISPSPYPAGAKVRISWGHYHRCLLPPGSGWGDRPLA